MSKLISLVVVVVIAIGAFVIFHDKNNERIEVQNETLSPSSSAVPTTSISPSASPTSTAVSTTVTVTYSDNGYSPVSVTIPVGGTVIFKNMSTHTMWTASNPHPIHSQYPVSGGCIASAFDECKGDKTGTSWSFTFATAGTWGYHNHLLSRDMGTVIVR